MNINVYEDCVRCVYVYHLIYIFPNKQFRLLSKAAQKGHCGQAKKRKRSPGRGNIPRKLGCLLRLKFTMNGVGGFVKKTTLPRLAKSAEPHRAHSTCMTLSRGMSEFFLLHLRLVITEILSFLSCNTTHSPGFLFD